MLLGRVVLSPADTAGIGLWVEGKPSGGAHGKAAPEGDARVEVKALRAIRAAISLESSTPEEGPAMTDRHIDDRPDEGYTPGTTHAERGAGNPRLRVRRDDERTEFALDMEEVRIGSAAGNELRLADTEPVHATVVHDDRDEYVVTLHADGEMNSNPDADATHPGDRTETLRTGSRFTVGPWELVFAREEFADHGRPFGGRQGGEYSDQPLQEARAGYDADDERLSQADVNDERSQSDSKAD